MNIFDKILDVTAKIPGVSAVTKYVPLDKVGHFAAGFVAGAAATAISGHQVVGILTGALAGIGKEAYDAYENRKSAAAGQAPAHTVDKYDAFATFLGGLVASTIVAVVIALV